MAHVSRASLLQQAESYQATVPHPCWPTGYHKSLSLSSIYDSPCTEKERPNLALNTTVTMVGTGNGSLCALYVSKLFNFTTCSFSRCSFDGIFQPEVSGNFIVSPGTERGGGLAASWAGVPSPPASRGGKARPRALQGWSLVPTTLVRAAVCGEKACSQPVPQLPPFLHQAFSAFFYTVDFIQTVMGKRVHLPSDLKDAAETICATSWSEVGSPGTVGRRGLLCVGHHPDSESSPWRGLGVLAPME